MSGLAPFTPPLTAKQIAAKLKSIGYGAPDADMLAVLYTNQLLLMYTLNEQGFDLPDSLLDQIDGFDPDEPATTEGLTQ
jgi:hypothetical protein